jgi:hypothetical protein
VNHDSSNRTIFGLVDHDFGALPEGFSKALYFFARRNVSWPNHANSTGDQKTKLR